MLIFRALARLIGSAIIAIAFLQWITFDYPDVNPFWPGAVLAPGMFSQFVNWIIVSVIGAIGMMVFKLGDIFSRDDDMQVNKSLEND